MECDIQPKVGSKVFKYQTVVHNCTRLAKLADTLNVPIVATHQVNFGPIDEQIVACHNAETTKCFEKSAFSMLGDQTVSAHLESLGKVTAVLYGLDTVVCMLQTAKHLLDAGYDVFVVVDATSSFLVEERNTGLQMLRYIGASLTTF